jgi:hypothetical protein
MQPPSVSQLNVFLYGSCVSRDALADDAQGIVLSDHYARSSLASLAGAARPASAELDRIAAKGPRRMVQADHDQSVLAAIAERPYDLLLIDLIEERFHLLASGDGSIVTLSGDYAAVVDRPLRGRRIPSGSDEHAALWRAGLARLVAGLRAAGRLDRVRVNRVFWAGQTLDGEPIEGVAPAAIERANAFLAARYKDLEAVFGPAAFLDYPAELLRADPAHPEGVSPFHYVPALYARTVAQLKARAAVRAQGAAPWTVELRPDDGWSARIVPPSGRPGAQYAFYLLRDGERVATRWYAAEPQARFGFPSRVGTFQVAAFVKHDGESTPQAQRSDPLCLEPSCVDLTAWRRPVFSERDADLAKSGALRNGIHRLREADGEPLDLLLDGFGPEAAGQPVLVCFSGAFAARAGTKAPYFSGLRVAHRLKLPLVALSDPTLVTAPDLGLAWYAGHAGEPALGPRIARVLDRIGRQAGSPLLLFGGSGGGFAALSVLGDMQAEAAAVVWNPQTSISRYYANSVRAYLAGAFGDDASPVPGEDAARVAKRLAARLEAAGIAHDLACAHARQPHPVLYLQNRSDHHHVSQHAQPYAKLHGAKRVSRSVFSADGGRLCFWFGNWGQGHVPPPAEMVLAVLGGLSRGTAVEELALQLEQQEHDDGQRFEF